MRRHLRWILPLAVLLAGVLGALAVIRTRPPVETRPPRTPPPLVRAMAVHTTDVQLRVSTQGTVEPRTESELVPEVSGRAVWVSSSLNEGGFFEEDDLLLRLDASDYEVAVEQARAALARAESEHHRAQRELERRRALAEQEFASEAALDTAENAARSAEAALREARALLRRAERDLERTRIRAPFAGRVRSARVDVGQFVTRGSPIATLYAVDAAEVRLPVADQELALIDVPNVYRGDEAEFRGPEVVLRARFAGVEHEWRGRVVRTEGEIDPKSRLVHLVARVEDPYGRRAAAPTPPLSVGLFVEAEILGRRVEDAAVLPRGALRDDGRVLVIDADDRLRFREVELADASGGRAVVRSGLQDGERVCLSPLEAVADGMKVRVTEVEPGSEPGPGSGLEAGRGARS